MIVYKNRKQYGTFLDFSNGENERSEFLKQYGIKINNESELEQYLDDIKNEKFYLVGAGCGGVGEDNNKNTLAVFNFAKYPEIFKTYRKHYKGNEEFYIIPTTVLESISIDFRLDRLADNI